MESEAGQEAEQAETTRMTEAPPWNVGSTNIKQDARQIVVEFSGMWRRGERCKDYFLTSKFYCACLFVFLVVVIVLALKPIFHHGTFPHEQCPSDWIGYKTKCYFISEEEENWTSSQTFCARTESLLAVFENQEEMHSLAKHLKIDDCWIGLSKKGESFYWENGIAFKEDSKKQLYKELLKKLQAALHKRNNPKGIFGK